MTIQFHCPNGHPMYANISQIGKTFACRKCGETAVVTASTTDHAIPSTTRDLEMEKIPLGSGVQDSISSKKSRTWLARFAPYAIVVCSCLLILLGFFFVYKWIAGSPNDVAGTGFANGQASDISSQQPLTTQVVKSKLRTIGMAWMNYENDTRRLLPPSDTKLSWRVHLLPYLGHHALYNRFRFNESWDSPINSGLIGYMPDVYRLTGNASRGHTRIQVAVGKDMIFGSGFLPVFSSITDGADDTLLAVVVGEDLSTPWTKPDTLEIQPDESIRSLGNLKEDFIAAIVCTGEPIFLAKDTSPLDFYAALTPRGGEAIELPNFILALESNPKNPASWLGGGGETSETNRVKPDLTKAIEIRKKNLKNVGDALLNYESAYKCYPVALLNPTYFDKSNRPNLSWRVHLLPLLGKQNLFKLFHLNEPWDSPHNLQLLKLIPDVYRDPMSEPGSTKTRILQLTGPNALFSGVGRGPKSREITDPLLETLLIVLAGPEKGVPWTKPEDLAYDGTAPDRLLGKMDMPLILGVFADNAVAVFDPSIPADIFNAFVTPRGNETFDRNSYLNR